MIADINNPLFIKQVHLTLQQTCSHICHHKQQQPACLPGLCCLSVKSRHIVITNGTGSQPLCAHLLI